MVVGKKRVEGKQGGPAVCHCDAEEGGGKCVDLFREPH